MGMTPYLAHALLPAGTDLTDVLARVARHAGATLTATEPVTGVEVRFGSYPFFIALDDGTLPHTELLDTRAHILDTVGTDAERGGEYGAVLTFGGADPDPDLNHVNDSVLLLEAIETLFPGAILFNPQSGERL